MSNKPLWTIRGILCSLIASNINLAPTPSPISIIGFVSKVWSLPLFMVKIVLLKNTSESYVIKNS